MIYKIYIYREIKLLSSLNHPSILGFIGFSRTDFRSLPFPTLLTEFTPNGTLRDIIKLEITSLAPNGWDDTRKLINIYGIAAGLLFLHSNEIIHRDLKPENILMDEYLFPKIADFGLSKLTNTENQSINIPSQSGYKGTPLYMSPEILLEQKYSYEGDVYAYGILVYEILTGKTPFIDLSLGQLIQKVAINSEKPDLTIDISQSFQELLLSCWSHNPEDRPTFQDIVDNLKNNSDFITSTVDEVDFYNYIDYIDEYKTSFDITNSIHYKDLMSKKGKTTKIEEVIIIEKVTKSINSEYSINKILKEELDSQNSNYIPQIKSRLSIKIMLLGESNVGKTSLLTRFKIKSTIWKYAMLTRFK